MKLSNLRNPVGGEILPESTFTLWITLWLLPLYSICLIWYLDKKCMRAGLIRKEADFQREVKWLA